MALFFNLDGAGLADDRVRLASGFTIVEGANLGNVEIGQLILDDPTGNLTVTGLRGFWIDETAASPQRLMTGTMWERQIIRGPYKVGAGRQYVCNFRDLNERLTRRVMHTKDTHRPAETDFARMAWLLASPYLAGTSVLVSNLGLVNLTANVGQMDATSYYGKHAMDVLVDMATATGKTAFVYWDDSAKKAGLFYDVPNATGHDSTLRISNVLADVDNTVTFFPLMDASTSRTPEDVYDSVLVGYRGAYVFVNKPATTATYEERETTFTNDKIGRQTTAVGYANQFLADHGTEVDTITVTIELPAAYVNGILPGHRVQVKFSHVPGFTSFTYMRVVKRTVSQREDQTTYNVTLELSNGVKVGIPTGGGTGGTGGFPFAGGGEHWYSGTFTYLEDSFGWAKDATSGSTMTSSSNTTGKVFSRNTTYNYSYTQVTQPGAYVPAFAFEAPLVWPFAAGDSAAFVDVGATSRTGSFTTTSTTDNVIAMHAAASQAGRHFSTSPVVVTWWVDPVGWTSNPPEPGQWVNREVPTPPPGGGNRVFFTQFAYVPNSLRVMVDNIDQTAATQETDNTTGKFTLNFDPTATEQIFVWYQAL